MPLSGHGWAPFPRTHEAGACDADSLLSQILSFSSFFTTTRGKILCLLELLRAAEGPIEVPEDFGMDSPAERVFAEAVTAEVCVCVCVCVCVYVHAHLRGVGCAR
jgi:hypothetical protein